MTNEHVQVVILAAGQGKRLGKSEPKVLTSLKGRPLVSYVLEDLDKLKHSHRPILVVGYGAEEVKSTIGSKYDYVHQAEQLGTGHAVAVTREYVSAPYIMVLNGDMPFMGRDFFLEKFISTHESNPATITLVTNTLENFAGDVASLHDYGRVVRDRESGQFLRIVEKRDASPEELQIMEVSPGIYIFEKDWLFENIDKLNSENAQHEYYLTDMVALAVEQGRKIQTVDMPPEQALGVNTPKQLEIAESVMMKQYVTV